MSEIVATVPPVNEFVERKSPVTETLRNPFIDAQVQWDELNRNLMLTRDELAQEKEENGRLNSAIDEAEKERVRIEGARDTAMNEVLAKHSAELAAKEEQIATLTRERDVFKTLSIQQTVRLRDLGEWALRIVKDSREATMNDPVLDAYAKPLVPSTPAELSSDDQALLAKITGTETAAAA